MLRSCLRPARALVDRSTGLIVMSRVDTDSVLDIDGENAVGDHGEVYHRAVKRQFQVTERLEQTIRNWHKHGL